jgi:hypothetical protein
MNNSISLSSSELAEQVEAIGFGPARSRTLVSKSPATAKKAIAFAAACAAKGFRFKVFQASGRNGYYARLRFMVITGDAPNAYTDSRGFTGHTEDCEAGSMGLTKAQISDFADTMDRLAIEAGLASAAQAA